MSSLDGARVLVTGGSGTIGSRLVDEVVDAGAAHVDVLDILVRGRLTNLENAFASGRVDLVASDIRDRDVVHDLTKLADVVFHQAAIRITQCAEDPRLALEVLVDGTFNVVEAAAAHRVDKLVYASSASVYGLAESFPTTERDHLHNNDTFYGAAKSFNEGMVRSFRAMKGLNLLGGGVTVGKGAYLGMGSSVREWIRIGLEAVVGMGAVVTRDITPVSRVAGIPARRLNGVTS